MIIFCIPDEESVLKFMKDNDYDGLRYPGFARMFKAQRFDADEWAELFVKAGAKFVFFLFSTSISSSVLFTRTSFKPLHHRTISRKVKAVMCSLLQPQVFCDCHTATSCQLCLGTSLIVPLQGLIA